MELETVGDATMPPMASTGTGMKISVARDELVAKLGELGASYRTMPFSTLATGWPNYEWWLAVNPGLPIEAYLPSWFVALKLFVDTGSELNTCASPAA